VGLSGLRATAQKAGDQGFSYGDLREVTLRGRLVSLGEELSRKYGARTAGAGPEGEWALALPEGQLYTFLRNDASRKLLANRPKEGAVEVRARLFPRSMLLEVLEFQPIPAESIKRRFHCDVCNLDTEDWGPCVCCGREMKPVP